MDDLRELQQKVDEMYRDRGYTAGPATLLAGVIEEVGELAMSLLLTGVYPDFKPSPRKLGPEWSAARDPAREVGDTITYLLALCNQLGIEPTFKWDNK